MKKIITYVILFLFVVPAINAETIEVPDDYPSIQLAIDAASPGDVILVAPGIYVENLNFKGKDLVVASHFILFGNEDFITQTRIDGNNQNSVVLFENGETNEAQLIGFTIENGAHDLSVPWESITHGGAIVCLNSSPTIKNNQITNTACTVLNDSDFGGIYCKNSSAKIIDNTIDSIYTPFTRKAGGIVAHNSTLEITGNLIKDVWGGYCYIGAMISADSSTLTLNSNIIEAGYFDVAPYAATLKLSNSIAVLKNNTLLGEIGLNFHNDIELTNNILLSPFENSAIIPMGQAGNLIITARYNNIKGGFSGTANFDLEPLFVDFDAGDYRLTSGSPCIDAGDPTSDFDPDGTVADLGAVFFDQSATPIEQVHAMNEVSFYPNPVSEVLNFRFSSPLQNARLRIYNTLGQMEKTVQFSGNTFGMECAGLKNAVYFFELIDQDNILGKGKFTVAK